MFLAEDIHARRHHGLTARKVFFRAMSAFASGHVMSCGQPSVATTDSFSRRTGDMSVSTGSQSDCVASCSSAPSNVEMEDSQDTASSQASSVFAAPCLVTTTALIHYRLS